MGGYSAALAVQPHGVAYAGAREGFIMVNHLRNSNRTKRKSILQVTGKMNLNKEDRDTIIVLLLKRRCTYEQACEYLLSHILYQTKDGILAELVGLESFKPHKEPES